MPERIQLRRTKGWRKPEGAITVARPTRWGNPFTVEGCMEAGYVDSKEEARLLCVDVFSEWLFNGERSVWWFTGGEDRWEQMHGHIDILHGKDLCCWCPPGPCHADALLELAALWIPFRERGVFNV